MIGTNDTAMRETTKTIYRYLYVSSTTLLVNDSTLVSIY